MSKRGGGVEATFGGGPKDRRFFLSDVFSWYIKDEKTAITITTYRVLSSL